MSITLEQVIADCEEEISDCQIDLDGIMELLDEYPERKEAFAHEIDDYKKRMDYNRQLAEWLKELAERRKQPEIIRCGECAHSNKEYSGEMWCGICNGFGIDENSFCSFAEKRYVENG